MYVGILRSGETQSEIFSELQVVEPEQFQRVEKAREQRSAEYEEKCAAAAQTVELADGEEIEVSRPDRMCPRRNVGRTLLSEMFIAVTAVAAFLRPLLVKAIMP